MQEAPPKVVWFRCDLRLDDHPAFYAAAADSMPILPVFIYDETRYGAASRWWLHHSLKSLERDLRIHGWELLIRRGDAAKILPDLCRSHRACSLFFNRSYEPEGRLLEGRLESELRKNKVSSFSFNGTLLFNPNQIRTGQGGPFKVFTPFWNRLQSLDEPECLGAPKKPSVKRRLQHLESKTIDSLNLIPEFDWGGEFSDFWTPGEQGARKFFDRFLKENLSDYLDSRDLPSMLGTSRLSPHLHFGEISVRRIWNEIRKTVSKSRNSGMRRAGEGYLRQLAWREFATNLILHFPATETSPLRQEFSAFKWNQDPKRLRAWKKGKTGYPMVDAGMRELWHTGWMHNRVRMIVGSFLVKDLLIDWREGARWFMDTLVDADLANNTFGWQWVAGCGADAAPFFRIFNPILQGEKFDPEGDYVRRWVPELSKFPAKWIHKPWLAPPSALSGSDSQVGKHYPDPIVNHDFARKRALVSYDRVRKNSIM